MTDDLQAKNDPGLQTDDPISDPSVLPEECFADQQTVDPSAAEAANDTAADNNDPEEIYNEFEDTSAQGSDNDTEENSEADADADNEEENDDDDFYDDNRKIVLIEKKEKNATLATSDEYENFIPKFSEDNMPKLDSEMRSEGLMGDNDQPTEADLDYEIRKAAAKAEADEAELKAMLLVKAHEREEAKKKEEKRLAKEAAHAALMEQESYVDNSGGDDVSPLDKLNWHRTACGRCKKEIAPLQRKARIWYAVCMTVTFIVILYIFTLFSESGQDFGVFFNRLGGFKNLMLLLMYLFLIYFVRGKNRQYHLKEAEYEKIRLRLLKKLDKYIEENDAAENFRDEFIDETETKYKIKLRELLVENSDITDKSRLTLKRK